MQRIVSILFFICLSSGNLFSQSSPYQFESILEKYHDKGLFNGNVLIASSNNILFEESFGLANSDQNIQNTVHTKFKIGSLTKQFTAALIMLLFEEGKLDLSDPISKFIPNYPLEQGNSVTIHHLLSHTSGIPDYLSLPQIKQFMFTENKPMDIVQLFWNLELEFEPGTQFKYSNSGYLLLGTIVENITNKTYQEALNEKIFKPLQMLDSGVYNDDSPPNNMAKGYNIKNSTAIPSPPVNASGAFAAGNLYSTINDLLKWERALLNNTILNSESLALMTASHTKQYGYGLGIIQLASSQVKTFIWGHEGDFFGFRSLIHIINKGELCIILLDNNENKSLMKLASEIRNEFYTIDKI